MIYEFTKQSNVVLYGAASIGNIMYNILINNGYKVCGFCDKRADEIEKYMGLPVYTLDSIPFRTDECVIIIAVKNVFEHDMIAKNFLELGYHRIIYKSYNELIGNASDTQLKMGKIYDDIMNNHMESHITLEEVFSLGNGILKDYGVISETESKVTAWIPISFVFTNNYGTESNGMIKWGNINVSAMFTHVNFFRHWLGDSFLETDIEDYVNGYCIYTADLQGTIEVTDRWKENVIQNRRIICEQMALSYEIDRVFFVNNAPTAEWNSEKKYFNLTSGKHRATFLAAKGCKYIPLKIKKEDYNLFVNMEHAMELNQYLMDNNIVEVEYAIEHPLFLRFPAQNRISYWKYILEKTRELAKQVYVDRGKIDFVGYSILDMSNTDGAVARHFAKMGAEVYCLISECKREQMILIDKVFGVTVYYITNGETDNLKTDFIL